VGRGPGHIVLDGDPAPLPKKWGGAPLVSFQPISIVAKWLDASRCHLVYVDLSPGDFVLNGNLAPSRKRGWSPLPNFKG